MNASPKYLRKSIRFQTKGSPTIEICRSALERIHHLAVSSPNHETGGILVGFNNGKDIRVSEASDAGPQAETSPAHFLRDTEYCRKFLADRYRESGADYVGEWHTHVVSLHALSSGDLMTLANIFVDPDYDFHTFAIILAVLGKTKPELHVYSAERDAGRPGRIILTRSYRGPFPENGESAGASEADEKPS